MAHAEFPEARVVTFAVADSSGPIERHDAVKLAPGDRTVALTDTAGESAFGVAQDAPRSHPTRGEYVAVVLKGARNARVSAAAEAGDTLVSSGAENGVLRPAAAGESSAGHFLCLASADSDGLGLVLVR